MDSNINSNIVIYDWLSFTSKAHTPEQLIEALGLTECPFTEIKGAHGYRLRKYYSCISIHYDGRPDMGVWVEMSGQGCRTFETMSNLSWDQLFRFIFKNGLHITRLDVAYDDHTGVLPLQRIADDVLEQRYVSRMNYWEVVRSSKGTTVQIGSPQSKVLIRIYDKAMERGLDDGSHWVRCEMQLRDDRAAEFTKIALPIGEAFAGVLINYLRFVVPNEMDTNRSRWETVDYWDDFINDVERISIFTAPGMEYNEERCKHYVVNIAGNPIDACIQMFGITEFLNMIKNRKTARNPKYDLLVQQHRRDQLAHKVRQWFDVQAPLDDVPFVPGAALVGSSAQSFAEDDPYEQSRLNGM